MKNKNSWDLGPKESLFNKKERMKMFKDYREKHPNEQTSQGFLCHCGKYHLWSELGRAHN